MKKVILASACALALAVGGATAQTQPAPGASSEGNVGPVVSKQAPKHMKHARHMKKQTPGQTTGMARSKGTSATPSGEAKQP